MKKFIDEDISINHKLYQRFLDIGVDDGWSVEDKLENFELFLSICNFTNHDITESSVLDAGCGTGDFAYFLTQHKVKEYLGIDIFEPAVMKAKQKYPDTDFLVADFFEKDLKKYDFVFASGSMTTFFATDNYTLLKSWIKRMWQLANKGIVFNVLLERFPDDNEPNLFLYNRQKVLKLAASISKNAKMRHLITDAGCGDGTEELHIYLYH